jgi:hypothetical protein
MEEINWKRVTVVLTCNLSFYFRYMNPWINDGVRV